ncbi:MAG: hypothetical protein WDW38_006321 [Sanguina aurantia]
MVCPWCYIGKRRLERAIASFAGRAEVEVRWHAFLLNPTAPKEGINKLEYYQSKFGKERTAQIVPSMTRTFAEEGILYSIGGLTGSTVDAHRLMVLAGEQGKQDPLVNALFDSYFTKEEYINDRKVLLAAAEKAGLQGASECLADSSSGLAQVQASVRKSQGIATGVPFFTINNSSGCPDHKGAEAFEEIFQLVLDQQAQSDRSSVTSKAATGVSC